MTAKNAVIGANAHPLYKWIVAEAGETAAPRWNFHKYLIGPKGELAGAFPSKVAPESPALTEAIEAALKP
jgi:glutathione peroxidase